MPDVKCVFRWTEAYNVNVAVLDHQHQELFDVVNELEQALRVGEGGVVIDRILDKLVTYVGVRFFAEESLLERHKFPGLLTHRIQHDMFRKKLMTYLEKHRGAKSGVAVEVLPFLQTWLKQHVQHTDKQYSAFLNQCGIR